MESDYILYVNLAQLFQGILHTDWDKMSRLGQSINNYPNGILLTSGPWQTNDKVHSDILPFPLGAQVTVVIILSVTYVQLSFSGKLSILP
jgi:hypothetical protein